MDFQKSVGEGGFSKKRPLSGHYIQLATISDLNIIE